MLAAPLTTALLFSPLPLLSSSFFTPKKITPLDFCRAAFAVVDFRTAFVFGLSRAS